MPRGLRAGWERRIGGWLNFEPTSLAEAVCVEIARAQAEGSDSPLTARDRAETPLWARHPPRDQQPQDPEETSGLAAWKTMQRWDSPMPAEAWLGEDPAKSAVAGEVLDLHWGVSAAGPFTPPDQAPPGMEMPEAVALMHGRDLALREWSQSGRRNEDLLPYTQPLPPREGHVPPRGQLAHPAAQAREMAIKAGGLPFPMVIPFPEDMLHQAEAAAWRERLIPTPKGLLGVPAYPGAEDPWLHWGTKGHPGGLVVAVVALPEEVLHIGDPRHPEDHDKFWAIHQGAVSKAVSGPTFLNAMRDSFHAHGITVIARHDLRAVPQPLPQEVWILKAAPPTLLVLAESLSP